MGRVLDSGAAGIMLPRMDSAGQVSRGDPAPAVPAARGPRGGHLQPGLPVRARPRRAGPGRTTRSWSSCRSNPRAAVAGRRRDRRASTGSTCCSSAPGTSATTSVSPATSPPRPSSRRWTRCWPRRSGTARPAGCSSTTARPPPPASSRAGRSWPSAPTPPCSPPPSRAALTTRPRPLTRNHCRHTLSTQKRRHVMVGHVNDNGITEIGCRPDQRGLDGQAAQPRLPGHPAGLPGAEDPAPAGARRRHRRRPGRLRPRRPGLRQGQHRLPRRAGRPRRRRRVDLRAEPAAQGDRHRRRQGRQAVLDREAGRPGRRRHRRGRRGRRGPPGSPPRSATTTGTPRRWNGSAS